MSYIIISSFFYHGKKEDILLRRVTFIWVRHVQLTCQEFESHYISKKFTFRIINKGNGTIKLTKLSQIQTRWHL